MRTCHPERRNCFAKRSDFGVEGSRDGVLVHRGRKAFSLGQRRDRENALRPGCRVIERKGSFDCARLRFANSRFAQDDSFENSHV